MKNRFINFLKVYKPLLIVFGVVLLVALILGLTCVGVVTMDTSTKLAHAEEVIYNGLSNGNNYINFIRSKPYIDDYGDFTLDTNAVYDFKINSVTYNMSGRLTDCFLSYDFYLGRNSGFSITSDEYMFTFDLTFSNFAFESLLLGFSIFVETYSDSDYVYDISDISNFENGDTFSFTFDMVSLGVGSSVSDIYLQVFILSENRVDIATDITLSNIMLTELDNYQGRFENFATVLRDEGYDEGYDVGYDVGYDDGYDDGYDVGYDEGYNAVLNDLTSNFMRYNYNGNANTLYQTSTYIGSISVSSFVDNGESNNLTITSNTIGTGTINQYTVQRYFTVPLAGWYNFSAIFNGVPSANYGILSKFSFYLCNADRTIVLGDSDIVSSSEPYDFSIYVDDTFANTNGSYTIYVRMLIHDYQSPVSGDWNQTWQIKGLTLESADNSLRDEYYTQGYADGERNANNTITTTSASYIAGFDEGYDDGKYDANNTVTTTSASYNAGYNYGVESASTYTFSSLLSAVFDVPVRTLLSMLNFEILGVDMSGFFLSLITICVVLFVIRLILGR